MLEGCDLPFYMRKVSFVRNTTYDSKTRYESRITHLRHSFQSETLGTLVRLPPPFKALFHPFLPTLLNTNQSHLLRVVGRPNGRMRSPTAHQGLIHAWRGICVHSVGVYSRSWNHCAQRDRHGMWRVNQECECPDPAGVRGTRRSLATSPGQEGSCGHVTVNCMQLLGENFCLPRVLFAQPCDVVGMQLIPLLTHLWSASTA